MHQMSPRRRPGPNFCDLKLDPGLRRGDSVFLTSAQLTYGIAVSPPSHCNAELDNRFVKVFPLGIVNLNQINLPIAMPLLDQLFPRNSGKNIFMYFEPNQTAQIVLLRKSIDEFASMFVSSLHQITRHPSVKCAISSIGEEINEVHPSITLIVSSVLLKLSPWHNPCGCTPGRQ